MTDEQLVELARGGDSAAEEEIIQRYKDTVRRRAHLYFIAGADSDDVIQEGTIGVFKAIRSFNPSRGTSFKTFAELCVNRQIMTAVSNANRQKHTPLNTSVSLSEPAEGLKDGAGAGAVTIAEMIPDLSNTDPETHMLLREATELITGNNSVFSDLELETLRMYLGGKSADDIASATGRSRKSVLNALGRARRKIAEYIR